MTVKKTRSKVKVTHPALVGGRTLWQGNSKRVTRLAFWWLIHRYTGWHKGRGSRPAFCNINHNLLKTSSKHPWKKEWTYLLSSDLPLLVGESLLLGWGEGGCWPVGALILNCCWQPLAPSYNRFAKHTKYFATVYATVYSQILRYDIDIKFTAYLSYGAIHTKKENNTNWTSNFIGYDLSNCISEWWITHIMIIKVFIYPSADADGGGLETSDSSKGSSKRTSNDRPSFCALLSIQS